MNEPDRYQEWADSELLLEHEAHPEQFHKATNTMTYYTMTLEQLINRCQGPNALHLAPRFEASYKIGLRLKCFRAYPTFSSAKTFRDFAEQARVDGLTDASVLQVGHEGI